MLLLVCYFRLKILSLSKGGVASEVFSGIRYALNLILRLTCIFAELLLPLEVRSTVNLELTTM